MKYALVVLAICSLGIRCGKEEEPNKVAEQETKQEEIVIPKVTAIKPSIQVDLGFSYYQNRSIKSIVDELVINGYQIVHYFVTNENFINKEFIDELRNAKVEVWLMTLGNGTYSTSNYPAGWQEWKMSLKETNNGASGFTFLSPFNKDFVQWKKKKLAEIVTKYSFDGIELAEAYFPAWNGPANPNYGDIGPNAAKAFKEAYGLEMPDFKNTSASNYYTKVPSVYYKWIEFRVTGINEFLNEIYNGNGGVREVRPDIKVATWSLGINAGNKSSYQLTENQGLDVKAMIKLVKPDLHYIQTHWPDWIKNEQALPPNYHNDYINFLREIKEVDLDLPVGIQADIGSIKEMIKSEEWLNEFAESAKNNGFSTFTAYEYHIGGHMYQLPPKVLKATRLGEDCVQLSFNKRVTILGTEWKKNFKFIQNNEEIDPELYKVELDGNQIRLYLKENLKGSYLIKVENIEDTPELWLHSGFNANKISSGSEVLVN
ncbi:hypothetical protein [Arenibacter sp. H213]|uniref:N-acyl-D-glucosamine 2-epimerase n=1 Tax=Arenibacter antarcticus TaxID=2040469 RepID=A0ABW5VI17_9FLAO|nr:hypothetical protein [Arenibacter sp. H213]